MMVTLILMIHQGGEALTFSPNLQKSKLSHGVKLLKDTR